MGFKKPFRAVPIRLGAHYRRKARREHIAYAARVMALAVFAGLVLAAISLI